MRVSVLLYYFVILSSGRSKKVDKMCFLQPERPEVGGAKKFCTKIRCPFAFRIHIKLFVTEHA